MHDLKLRKLSDSENGYLLLENLITLIVIMTLLVILYPLITNWIIIRKEAKHELEMSRVLYETSTNWPIYLETDYPFTIKNSDSAISIHYLDLKVGVEIYEANYQQ